jgi:hydrogenase nickel incorporation protein HypA/HybF
MHEVSIATSIIQIIEDRLLENSKGYVTAVNIKVGQLSNIETEALLFSFDIVKSSTLLSKATLNIEIIEGKGECSDCGETFSMHSFATPCPACNSYLVRVLGGKEMKVVSYDIEEN